MNPTHSIKSDSPRRTRQLLGAVADDLRGRRQARSEKRRVERELGTHVTPGEINDVLAALRPSDGPEVERMRTIVVRNLEHQQRTRLAS